MSALVCPGCGSALTPAAGAPADAPIRCKICDALCTPPRDGFSLAAESGGPTSLRPAAVSTTVSRVVRNLPPEGAPAPGPRVHSGRIPRPTMQTPALSPAQIAAAMAPRRAAPAGPLSDLLDPGALPRFAVLSVLDDSRDDRLVQAVDQTSQRLVALRIGRPGSDAMPRRIAHEQVLLKAVQHRNVVALVDAGSAAGLAWIAYQYVEGAPLRRKLDAGPLGAREATLAVAQLLDGLAAMHRAGWVHRELSLDRVRETDTGLVKLCGFARALTLDPSGSEPFDAKAGDPRYLAPEQARGERPGPAADLYAAGAVLYELVTGAPPFLAGDANLLAMRHAQLTPDAPSARVAVPAGFDTLVLRALAKAPGERFASAVAMGDALRALVG